MFVLRDGMVIERIVAVDVHRRGRYPYVIGVADLRTKKTEIRRVDTYGLFEFFEKEPVDLVIYEATGVRYSAFLQGILEQKQIPHVILGARELGAERDKSAGMDRKSDQNDVRAMIAAVLDRVMPRLDLEAESPTRIIIPPPPESQRMRAWIHERERWDKEIARYLNRVEKNLAALGIRRRLPRTVKMEKFLKGLREEIEAQVREEGGEVWYNGWRLGEVQKIALDELRFLLSDEFIRHIGMIEERKKRMEKNVIQMARKHRYYPSLMDIQGVGEWTAAVLIAWIWDVRRFPTPGAMKKYLKLLSKRTDSSNMTHRRRRTGYKIPVIKKVLYILIRNPHLDERIRVLLDFYSRKGGVNTYGQPRNPRWVAVGKWLERMWYVWWEIERGNEGARLRKPRPWKGWRRGRAGAIEARRRKRGGP